ncbi:FIST domain protein [Geotalea daltonii FRC-32]|uniref:FIST domain protein n=1 Tax=Geotalea daltonii (strain DSM 22248 / JCM 15807 / FRC-32) TaxID=316067 RepID=B9M796_GEODF|nr:FIST N-terminal domain-containing protein [Geotalea daltonii]ACM20184.1 FIST domain protein [Geotalea daltonii FRC-32]
MATVAGVGFSTNRNPREAGREAALKALEQKGIGVPDFVFVFASVGYDQQLLIQTIRGATGRAPLAGCSGEGIITQRVALETNFCVCVMTIKSDELHFLGTHVTHIAHESDYGGERLAAEIRPWLGADTIGCFLFIDGLIFDFDPFKASLERCLPGGNELRLFGGLAADNWVSRRTYQYHDDEVFSEGISCVHMSGSGRIACGINHGCVPIGTKHVITRSKGNVIYEIDGIPVLELLKDYVEGDWESQWNKISLNLCLGFRAPESIKEEYGDLVVRYMMGKDDRQGCVMIQSDVRAGTELWIVRRDKELIRNGLVAISDRIKQQTGNRQPKFVMQFECMGRGKVVFREQEKNDLITTLQQRIGQDVPWIGFYTYGEIGPVSRYNCLHNFTAVVTAVY